LRVYVSSYASIAAIYAYKYKTDYSSKKMPEHLYMSKICRTFVPANEGIPKSI
jgi:hypothetical protein